MVRSQYKLVYNCYSTKLDILLDSSTCSPIHLPTHPLTHSLTHPPTHPLTHSLTHPPTHSGGVYTKTISPKTGKCMRIQLQRFSCLHDAGLPEEVHLTNRMWVWRFQASSLLFACKHEPKRKKKLFVDRCCLRTLPSILCKYKG